MSSEEVARIMDEGPKVFVEHKRYHPETWADGSGLVLRSSRHILTDHGSLRDVSPRGGKTIVTIILSSGREVRGVATCSMRDNFSRSVGRKIALGRAIKAGLAAE